LVRRFFVIMVELILASTSPYRRQLLEQFGLPFRVLAPQVNEGAIQALFDAASAADLAEHLAIAKAVSVARQQPEAVVIGSDQVAVCADRILGKPGSACAAAEQLAFLAGKRHQLITAVCIAVEGKMRIHRDVTTLTMRPLTPAEVDRYIAADSPLDCGGSYKLEARGIALFERIDTADHTAITGLPLLWLATALRELGYSIP
jgi:septum formation protein